MILTDVELGAGNSPDDVRPNMAGMVWLLDDGAVDVASSVAMERVGTGSTRLLDNTGCGLLGASLSRKRISVSLLLTVLVLGRVRRLVLAMALLGNRC